MSEYNQSNNSKDFTVAQTLGRIEGKLDDLNTRVSEIVTQIKDHAKRLDRLEHRQMWASGWIAGAIAFGAIVEWIIGKM